MNSPSIRIVLIKNLACAYTWTTWSICLAKHLAVLTGTCSAVIILIPLDIPKLVITTPWKVLCVDLIGPYTCNGKDGSSIDFMCLTMIDPATSWFKIVELPTLQRETSGSKVTNKNTKEADMMIDKSSAQISNLVYKTWFSRYPRCRYSIYDNRSEFKLHFQALCDSYGIKRKPTSVKNPQENAILDG